MARFDRLTVLNTIVDQGIMTLFHDEDLDTVIEVATAVYAGGGRIFEFTNRVEHALDIFGELVRHAANHLPDLIVGTGSVEDAPTAAQFIANGSSFIVSPILVEETAYLCNRRKIAYLPGTMTIKEVADAETLGVELVKFYPASLPMGAQFVSATLMPRPWSRIVANGMITVDDLEPWFEAGVAAVGTMSMVQPDLVQAGDFETISQTVGSMLAKVEKIRSKRE